MDQNTTDSRAIENKRQAPASRQSQGTLQTLAHHILKTNVEKLKTNAAALLIADNSAAIHDMRVAARRLRAALKTFKSILPSKAKKLRAELQKIGRILGAKRDLDVFSAFIQPAVHASAVSLQKLAEQNAQALKRILFLLKTKAYMRLIATLEELKIGSTKQNPFELGRKLIRQAFDNVLVTASVIDATFDDKTLHQLRIGIKKLRYTCEFFEPVFRHDAFSLAPLIEESKNIQDILGAHQDAIAGILMLGRYENIFSADEFTRIEKKYVLQKRRTHQAFLKAWPKFKSPSFSPS